MNNYIYSNIFTIHTKKKSNLTSVNDKVYSSQLSRLLIIIILKNIYKKLKMFTYIVCYACWFLKWKLLFFIFNKCILSTVSLKKYIYT